MSSILMWIIVVIAAYLIFVLFIGFRLAKHNETTEDFYLGGRQLGPYVTAMSAEASDMSSWLLLGIPGLVYISGLGEAFWTCIGLGIGTYLNWLFVAKRLRVYSQITDSFTVPQFMAKRFHDGKNVISSIAAVIIIIFFIPYVASGFAACGKLFNTLFGVNYMTAVVISAIVIIGYTAAGGFLAASTTDFVQGIVMSIALLLVLVCATVYAGGIGTVMDNASAIPGYVTIWATHNFSTGASTPYGFLTIVSTLAWGIGYFGMPHILLRFMGINDKEKITVARRVGTIWVFIAMGVAIVIGYVGYALSTQNVIENLTTAGTAETVIIKMSYMLAEHSFLLTIGAGVVVAGILACTMSTADSQLLAAASSFSEDIYTNAMHKDVDVKKSMSLARLTVIVMAIVALFIARNPNSSVFRIVSFAWAGFGAAFGPLMLFSLFWKRTTLQGALAGLVSGGVMVFVWKFLLSPKGGVLGIYELLPAAIISTILIVVVSLMTPEPSAEIMSEFDKMEELSK